jgi:hypothetical protein
MMKKDSISALRIPNKELCGGFEGKTYWLCPFLNVENRVESCNAFVKAIDRKRLKECSDRYPHGATIKIEALDSVEGTT